TSVKNQRDESLRILLDWNRKGNTTNTYFKTAYIRDYVWYRDAMVLIDSKNFTNQVYTEAGIDHRFNRHHKLLLFTPIHISWIDTIHSHERFTQIIYALADACLYTAFNARLNVSLNGRGEIINDISILLPGIDALYD